MLMRLADPDTVAFDGRVESALPSPRIEVLMSWNPPADRIWQRILTEVGGKNLYGDPMLRLVNGSSRLELIGGIWENNEEEDAGLPSLREQWDQRYPWLEEFWLVEEWIPTTISRHAWEARERKTEDGITFLEHPIYPSRGRYVYYSHFRRLVFGVEIPEQPTPGGLRYLASRWRRLREKSAPPELEVSARERERRIEGNTRVMKERRLRAMQAAKRAKRDIWENEVGGPTGITPQVSLAGLDVPRAAREGESCR